LVKRTYACFFDSTKAATVSAPSFAFEALLDEDPLADEVTEIVDGLCEDFFFFSLAVFVDFVI